jgi:transposase
MLKAHKIRLNPTPLQDTYFFKAAGTTRFAYNWAVAKWREATDGIKSLPRCNLKNCLMPKNRKGELSLSERVFRCESYGLEIDRDENAALNLLEEGLRIALVNSLSGTGLDGH